MDGAADEQTSGPIPTEIEDGFLRENLHLGDIDIGPNSIMLENYHNQNYYGMSRHRTNDLK